jgi:hypothetical protein
MDATIYLLLESSVSIANLLPNVPAADCHFAKNAATPLCLCLG